MLEDYALANGKMLVYLINKADLIDVAEVESSGKVDNLNPHVFISTVTKMGRGALRDRIKIEAKRFARLRRDAGPDSAEPSEHENLEIHKHGIGNTKFLKVGKEVHIGIIGYPNVGKSSIINMLSGTSAARTSPRAGFTRGIQKVRFAPGILLLDTPGVMSDEDAAASQSLHLKKHAIIGVRTYDSMKNPEFIIAEIMGDNPGLFESHYGIDANGDSEILLEELGKKWNFLNRGGVIDTDRTARKILKEWQAGKIREKKMK